MTFPVALRDLMLVARLAAPAELPAVVFLCCVAAGVFHARMTDRLDAAPLAHDPDKPCDRLHRHEHPLEQPAEELGLGRVTSRELLDLGDERPDLAACPFDFDRLVDAHLDSVRPHSRSCVIVLRP